MSEPSLDGAYALNSLDDTKRLYADWAESYDSDFAGQMDFTLPASVAEAFAAAGGAGPVLDFGCGTGLIGERLTQLGVGPLDGADLSKEMLAVAARKGCYGHLVSGDVLDGYHMPGAPYAGVVSSGTFTNGHVGPEAISILLDLAAPGALFALSVNKQHFEALGFQAALDGLADRIAALELPEVRFYGPNATGAHKDDTGYIATFRKR
ncbi:hypothetical protein AIOL_004704 [Candidatus Rhodobacter oscarellae]|uniref:Methyltransferase domain-containing protein n=1 Tax=Candidatus Rhodobacter oscarellae TaxID=1675527 RepID=A0A0J9EAS6_9RHOB|nr:methyltransferase domain-containing protein [Candidatus Rhodobacter lobularis]KMW59721.1 hypothetical protein AIOL_004704 [Candidatus Rhodobacter lobularis]